MIEFLLGIAVSTVLFAVGTRRSEDDHAELVAENRHLRAGLRYIREVPLGGGMRAYIDRLLRDEAGS